MNIPLALQNIRPGSSWELNGESYDGLIWREENTQPKPSREEVMAEVERLRNEGKNKDYQRKRMHEYPDIREYLDAVVKNDPEAIQQYVDKCLAVKAKYPKPEEQ